MSKHNLYKMKPRIFIASSTEHLDVAHAVQLNLDYDAEITVWAQADFQLSSNVLDDLVRISDDIDFGIFILSPEDIVRIRNQEYWAARDNVVFELGLFIGKVGRERNFLVVPRSYPDLRLPTDLAGINVAEFESQRSDKNLRAALGSACSRIRDAVQRLGKLPNPVREAQSKREQLIKVIHRLVEMLQVSFSEVKRGDWKLIYSINEKGDGHLYEEVTLIPSEIPLYFCLVDEVFKKNLDGESAIHIAAKSLTYGTSLQIVELERTNQSAKYAILLDPPSTRETPQRIAIDYDCTGIWNDLIETGEDQGLFRANFQPDNVQIEFLAPAGRIWKWFTPSPQMGNVQVQVSTTPSRVIWNLSNPPTRRYSYRLSLKKR